MIYYGLPVCLGPLDEIPTWVMRKWRNDYRVWRYCRQNDLLTAEKHFDWLRSEDPSRRMYSILKMKDKEPVGVAGLTSIDLINRRAEFSLYINPDERKKGYAKAGLMTLLSHGFSTLGLNSIFGEVFEFNPAFHLFERVGFHLDGKERSAYYREGKFIDAYRISILRYEWQENELFDQCRWALCFT